MDLFRTIEFFWTERAWLGDRMLFLSGPRQVGKTTLIRERLCQNDDAYFNWDNRKVRLHFQQDPEFFAGSSAEWLCFDEIHKRKDWKDILKGAYDTFNKRYRFVISGSAKLDTFKRSGDSLVGRYFHTHLFPLNLSDFSRNNFLQFSQAQDLINLALDNASTPANIELVTQLIKIGGFPEPFSMGSEQFWQRWSQNHFDLIVQEDIRSLSRIQDVDKIEMLLERIRRSIGSTLSYRKCALELECTHQSISRWLTALQKVQLIFAIAPYSRKINRAIRQEQKFYLNDWAAAEENHFENYVAASLYRAVTLANDRFGSKLSLHYIRTVDGVEVDFLLCKNAKPWLLIESKESKTDVPHGLQRFSRELNVPGIIVTKRENIAHQKEAITFLSWSRLAPHLP